MQIRLSYQLRVTERSQFLFLTCNPQNSWSFFKQTEHYKVRVTWATSSISTYYPENCRLQLPLLKLGNGEVKMYEGT